MCCILQDINDVHVRFPNKDIESDFVTIHGEKARVERVMEKIKYLKQICYASFSPFNNFIQYLGCVILEKI